MNYFLNYIIYFFAIKFSSILKILEDIENLFFLKKKPHNLNNSIYVCGCPRSGTTIITHLLSNCKDLGYFQYKDVPFIFNLFFWSKINKLFYLGLKKSNRIHGDNLKISPESPDSFEELFWARNLKNYETSFSQILEKENSILLKNYKFFIDKLLFIKNKKIYLTKNNYNVFRLKFLLNSFPNLKIIYCFRHPFDTVNSMVKVHNNFKKQGMVDKYFYKKLNYLCHFEFGSKRKAFKLNDSNYSKALDHWNNEEDFNGYLLQWIDLHNYVLPILKDPKYKKNILLINNDEIFKNSPKIKEIFNFCEKEFKSYYEEDLIQKNQINNNYNQVKTDYSKEALQIYNELLNIKNNF